MEFKGKAIGIGLVAGMNIGVVVGAITDNVGIWIAMGVVFGIVVGAGINTILASQAAENNVQ